MSDDDLEIEESPKPEVEAKEAPVARRDRRATDQPQWFQNWLASQKKPDASSDDSEDDDGILSIEELPDVIEDVAEDVIEGGKELVESIPERTHFLFGKVFGKKE